MSYPLPTATTSPMTSRRQTTALLAAGAAVLYLAGYYLPLLDIGGRTMIQRVVEQAAASSADQVLVATDDERIAAAVYDPRGRSSSIAAMTDADLPSGTDRVAVVARQQAAIHRGARGGLRRRPWKRGDRLFATDLRGRWGRRRWRRGSAGRGRRTVELQGIR